MLGCCLEAWNWKLKNQNWREWKNTCRTSTSTLPTTAASGNTDNRHVEWVVHARRWPQRIPTSLLWARLLLLWLSSTWHCSWCYITKYIASLRVVEFGSRADVSYHYLHDCLAILDTRVIRVLMGALGRFSRVRGARGTGERPPGDCWRCGVLVGEPRTTLVQRSEWDETNNEHKHPTPNTKPGLRGNNMHVCACKQSTAVWGPHESHRRVSKQQAKVGSIEQFNWFVARVGVKVQNPLVI